MASTVKKRGLSLALFLSFRMEQMMFIVSWLARNNESRGD